jgi:hypothetical protein
MSLGLPHIRRTLMLKRLLDWIIPDHALRQQPLGTIDMDAEPEYAKGGIVYRGGPVWLTPDDFPLVRISRHRAEGKTTTTRSVPCTCSPRHDPPDYTDPNCWACNRGA